MSEEARVFVHGLFEGLAAPVLALRAVDDRVYFPYLLGAGVIGVWVWWSKLRRRVSLPSFLFSAKVWLHPSALFDLRFMVARALLGFLVFAPFAISSAHLAVRLRLGLNELARPSWHAPDAVALLGVSLAAFLLEDLTRYGLHRLSHRVPALWELHKVHHSAEVLTPFTIYRTHPIEGLMMRTGSSLALASGTAVASWLLGAPLSLWEVLGVQGLSLLWNATGSNLRHSQIWLSYPNFLQRLLVSPAGHQIHHSKDKRHFDRNFGSVFALWDWFFGTLYVTGHREALEFGLPEQELNHERRVISALVRPVAAALHGLFPGRSAKKLPIKPEASYHSARP